MAEAAQPNTTLYIQNLDTKISKDDLRRLLYIYFSTYGKVLDVVALKNDKMRGQAFVVFKDLSTSTAALRKENGRAFAGKAMKIQYAQGKSFATIEDESGKEALYQYRMGIIMNPDASRKLTVSGAGKALSQQNKRDRADGEQNEDEEGAKRARLDDNEEEEMEMSEEEESDGEAVGPTPAS
ncbi:RNA-binding domain-containing protein [Cystobasidium minutum MCA 4210]|uniref:RNA-binding domain-containing protein n=1 Tax=Cystobasidium minutum MCA 4210 TaxID=1397322 RepID=UPI0034CE81C7|eukprot:jgi/Rhomi1/195706/gm1.3920_g